jgi:hypothetical protein
MADSSSGNDPITRPQVLDQTMTSFELLDIAPNADVQESEFKRLLGYPVDHALEGRALELAVWAREWYRQHGTPWIYARRARTVAMHEGIIRIDGIDLLPGRLYERMVQAEAGSAMLVAVSAGAGCEEYARKLWEEGKPDEYFFLEIYGSAVVEHLVAAASFRLCEWADGHDAAVLPHYSPGYPEWAIADQPALWQLISGKAEKTFPERLEVLETGMLRPKKSLLAVFGITHRPDVIPRLTELIPCESCSLPACRYRRTAQKYSLPRIEQVPRGEFEQNALPKDGASLQQPAPYTLSPRALRLWSRERLRLKFLADRSVEASFRYDGTTCSNLGTPLAFDYHIRLGTPSEGYPILEATCSPSAEDTGYTHMCEYIKGSRKLMESITSEKPLVGQSLDNVFAWKRPYNPAACYCSLESRDHKWGMAFEVLHYALASLPGGIPSQENIE